MAKGIVAGTSPVPIEVEGGKTYYWCACGKSANQPFCDGSHKGSEFAPVAWTAEETGRKFFCACKQTDGQPFCDGSHATAEAIAEREQEASAPVIEQRENGPIVVKHLKKLLDEDGNEIEIREVVALCRCGGSKNKPFCDGSHRENGFTSANGTENADGRVFSYEGEQVTVHFNKLLCAHAGECGRINSAVFNVSQKPWVRPDEGTVESIREVIEACPSGALRLEMKGGEPIHLQEDESLIRVQRNGSYHVHNVEIGEPAKFAETATADKYVLCRCGLSKNKPFCDGTHYDEKWRAD
ncbi:MAG: CDGSH iron-sulfur domain-containing protein [Nitratireductor sp.]|nr:CDGSH iron-sulfur domain-containing protein [Nitratireductor sp.]